MIYEIVLIAGTFLTSGGLAYIKNRFDKADIVVEEERLVFKNTESEEDLTTRMFESLIVEDWENWVYKNLCNRGHTSPTGYSTECQLTHRKLGVQIVLSKYSGQRLSYYTATLSLKEPFKNVSLSESNSKLLWDAMLKARSKQENLERNDKFKLIAKAVIDYHEKYDEMGECLFNEHEEVVKASKREAPKFPPTKTRIK